MSKLIGSVVILVILGVGFFVIGCSDKPEETKTEKQMIIQETKSTNRKLSNR